MKNNFLLESTSPILIQEEIDSIIKILEFENSSRNSYDLSEVPLMNAIEDLDTYSFLSDKKIIIITNIFEAKDSKEMEHLFKYLEKPSSLNLLFIVVDKLDNKLTITKKLKNCNNIEYRKLETDPYLFAKNKLSTYNISQQDIRLLVEKCMNDITTINSECEKLMIYKLDSKDINKEDIELMVVKKLGDSSEILFSFINALLQKNKKRTMQIYKELQDYQIDISSIIGLLASQLKLIAQIKILKMDNLKNIEIQEKLQLKSLYQIKKLSEYTYYSLEEIKNMIFLIEDIDYKIKSGRLSNENGIIYLITNLK